jgi:hypothetical protein
MHSVVRLYSLSVTKQAVVPTFEDCNAEAVSTLGIVKERNGYSINFDLTVVAVSGVGSQDFNIQCSCILQNF